MTLTATAERPAAERDEHPSAPAVGDQKLPRWRLRFPLARIVKAEIVALAVGFAMTVAGLPWWAPVIAAVALLLVVTVTYRGATTLGWLGRVGARRKAKSSAAVRATRAAIPAPFNVDLPGVGPVGMRWDGQYAITMIALHGRAFPPTALVAEGADTIDTVPLQAIGALLEQFGGLELHSIDAVSVGCRTAPTGRYTPRYEEIIGDRPAVGERRTWLVLRLNPQECMDALSYRGDIGVAVAAATERIRQAAVRDGCRAVMCSPEQIDAATDALLGGHELARYEEHWAHLQVGNEYVTPYRVAGTDLTTRLLNDLWTIRSTTTVTVVRLTRAADGSLAAGVLVRLHTAMPLPHPPLHTLHRVAGQAFSALLASLPLGDRALELPLAAKRLAPQRPRVRPRLGDKKNLVVPVGSSGFLFGMTLGGFPFLMSITDPLKYTKVALNADVYVVQSLVLRATAAGATALVHTDRPAMWSPICDDRIMLAERTEPRVTPTLVVADGEAAQRLLATTGERGHALIVVTNTPPADSDVVVTQVAPGQMVLTTPSGREVPLTIMRPRNEAQYLSHLRARRAERR